MTKPKHRSIQATFDAAPELVFSPSELAAIVASVMTIHGTEDVGFCREDIVDDPFERWRRSLAQGIEDEIFANLERELTGDEEDAVERFVEERLAVLTCGGLIRGEPRAAREDGREHAT